MLHIERCAELPSPKLGTACAKVHCLAMVRCAASMPSSRRTPYSLRVLVHSLLFACEKLAILLEVAHRLDWTWRSDSTLEIDSPYYRAVAVHARAPRRQTRSPCGIVSMARNCSKRQKGLAWTLLSCSSALRTYSGESQLP